MFVDSVRMHSKRILMISGSLLLFLIATVLLTLNSYGVAQTYTPDKCHNISLHTQLCPVIAGTRIGFSVLSVLWNLLVGVVMLSVCRTQTIGKIINYPLTTLQ